MEKRKKYLSLIVIFTFIAYSLLVIFNHPSYALTQTISSDINGINEQAYPGIKDRINSLKAKYPNWNFKVLYTNLDWNEVISNEYVGHNSGPRNQIQAIANYQGAWICPACNYQNGSWRCASEAAIKYMMDPRNSLNASDIFQFEELTNNGYDMNVINSMVNGTFLAGHNGEIASAANNSGVNPYYIIARLLQEQGNGSSPLVNGSQGYYNPFNIQATGNSDAEVIANGIAYARKKGWDTLEKGITGGINFLADEYTKKGQNTLYLQKFDVENTYNGLYWHQYMQNLMAAQSEGNTLRKTYQSMNAVSSSHTFIIPLYNNMPQIACSRPDGNSNATVTEDIVKVNVISTINLRNAPNGTVIGQLRKDEIVTRIEKANQRNGKTYWDKVRRADGTVGYVARETDYDEASYKLYLVPVNDNNNGNNNAGNNDSDNNPSNSGNTNTEKLGDIDGNGVVDSTDLLYVKKYLLSKVTFDDNQKKLADVNKDGTIDSTDLLYIKKYLLGQITL